MKRHLPAIARVCCISAIAGISLTSCGDDEPKKINTGANTPMPSAETEDAENTPREFIIVDQLAEVADTETEKAMASIPLGLHEFSADTFRKATEQDRMVIVFVGGINPAIEHKSLAAIAEDRSLLRDLNEVAIPVFADLRQHFELNNLAVSAITAAGSTLRFPLVLWMTPNAMLIEGHSLSDDDDFTRNQIMNGIASHGSVWLDDSEFITKRADLVAADSLKLFVERQKKNAGELITTRDGLSEFFTATIALYDAGSLNFYGSGASVNPWLARLAQATTKMPEVSRFTQKRAQTAVDGIVEGLMTRPVFDPVDHLFFAGSVGSDNRLFRPVRSGYGNTAISAFLFDYARRSGDSDVLDFAEKHFAALASHYITDGGLFVEDTLLHSSPDELRNYFSIEFERAKSLLSADELAYAEAKHGIRPKGNILIENDPSRQYGSRNILTNAKNAGEVGQLLGWDAEKVASVSASFQEKMRQYRAEMIPKVGLETFITVRENAAFISALIARAKATNDSDGSLKAAADLLAKLRSDLVSDSSVARGYIDGQPAKASANALDIIRLAEAALELHSATGEPDQLAFAKQLVTLIESHYINDSLNIISERDRRTIFSEVPMSTDYMIFEPSTVARSIEVVAQLNARNAAPEIPRLLAALPSGLAPKTLNAVLSQADILPPLYQSKVDTHVVVRVPAQDEQRFAHLTALENAVPAGVSVSLETDSSLTAPSYRIFTGKDNAEEAASIDEMLTILTGDK